MNVRSLKFKFLFVLICVGVIYFAFTTFGNSTIDVESLTNALDKDATERYNKNETLKTLNDLSTSLPGFSRPGDNFATKKFGTKKKKKRFTLSQKLKNVPAIKVEAVNCRALFEGDPAEQMKAEKYHSSLEGVTYSSDVPATKSECNSYLSARRFAREPADREEAEFPVAFSILVYKDFHQFEKLLRAIYRPQNFYCIHVDSKSDSNFKRSVRSLVDCFEDENIFVSPASYNVQWATITVLKPEIDCMMELWKRFPAPVDDSDRSQSSQNENIGKAVKKKPMWRYFINLTGQEFPLRTMLEIVRILKIFNGSNNAEATRARMNEGVRNHYEERRAPRGLVIWKGSVHVVVTREFVDFALHHPVSAALLHFLQTEWVPDEHFFSTLNNNPKFGVPGSYTGSNPETDTEFNRFVARFKNWGYPPFGWPCRGKWVRQICNFGVGDLPLLASRDELFTNKFDYSFEPLAYDCMEELLYNRTRKEYRDGFLERKASLGRRIQNSKGSDVAGEIQTESPAKSNSSVKSRRVGLNNRDHLLFADKEFYTFGDQYDGNYAGGPRALQLFSYLRWMRPTIHEPGEVDFDHYRDLDFTRNHLHVPHDWTFAGDDGFEVPHHNHNTTQPPDY